MIDQTIAHYRITRELGAGGMGVVYEAVDIKLDRTVALKFLPPESVRDPDAKARFIHEAKAASSLDHPNICTIHAIEETDDGRLFIAMARYEGETLKDMIERGPLEIPATLDIITQTLQGLGKAHRLGIVHRDIKPANVFVTEDGLVKLLDFGIAKLIGKTQVTKTGSLVGTVHYMAPEQLQGDEVDRRADLWSAGVLLHEMLTGQLPFTGDHPPAIMYSVLNTDPEPLAGVRKDTPPELAEAVARCLAKSPADRHQGVEELLLCLKPLATHTVIRTEDARTVSLRGEADALNVQPYPGLASFTEDEVEFFHGRESKVESVWQKLRRGRLLAVSGPSGVGKTSFLRAGLIPAKPADWGVIVTKPGASPLLSLRQAMVPELTDDTGAIQALLQEQDLDATVAGIRRWRDRHDEALLILDQFEELFTLSPRPEQERFADLLSRLTFEADVRVLVSLRDDFLFHCQEFAGLAPLYESLTVLGSLTGAGLRRALVQPAVDCGYAFEDESVIDEMMAEVEGERGALPLLAFAMARLWERRDREQGLLTRRAYEEMGAVSGALAQHAESVMDQIGTENHPIVQELFRNLVTAQGTRTVQTREKIISVFQGRERPAAEDILNRLIDARLLTSYEMKGEDGTEHHRIEVVHESLLNAWPRLVRWRTQDEDSAQMRDQVRQAAQLWEQKDRSNDLLWTGTAFMEFELWRGRYPGGLSSEEEDFAAAMKSRNLRRKRRRRVALSGAFIALLAVLVVVGAFGKRAQRMARVSEARRLHMLAEEQVEVDNSLALAIATASLEREDNPEVRKLALSALWKGPSRSIMTVSETLPRTFWSAQLSEDGKWLASSTLEGAQLWSSGSEKPLDLKAGRTPVPYKTYSVSFNSTGEWLMSDTGPQDTSDWESPPIVHLWSVPETDPRHMWKLDTGPFSLRTFLRGNPPFLLVAQRDDPARPWLWQKYTTDDDRIQVLGRADTSTRDKREFVVDPSGRYLLDWKDTEVYLFPLDSLESASPILVGRHDNELLSVAIDRSGKLIASTDMSGDIRVWSLGDNEIPIFHHLHGSTHIVNPVFSPDGNKLLLKSAGNAPFFIYDLRRPGAEPMRFLPRSYDKWFFSSFSPDGSWLVAPQGSTNEIWFYLLTGRASVVKRIFPSTLDESEYDFPFLILPGKSQFIAQRGFAELWLWDLDSEDPQCRLLIRHPEQRAVFGPICDPSGRYVMARDSASGRAWLIPMDEREPRPLGGFDFPPRGIALSQDSRLAAVGGRLVRDSKRMSLIRLWDLETDDVTEIDPGHDHIIQGLEFMSDGRLISASDGGLRIWNPESGECEVLSSTAHLALGDLSPDERFLVAACPAGVILWDLEMKKERVLPIAIEDLTSFSLTPDVGFILAGRNNGELLALDLNSNELHHLLGHEGRVNSIEAAPGGTGILSLGADGTLREWAMPQGRPLMSMPLDELVEVLHAQTNMRIVTDVETEEGYRIEYDRFPGWETVPEW